MTILMIIAKTNFKDEEFKEPYKVFTDNKLKVDIGSTTEGNCIGKSGWQVDANISLKNVNISDYSGIILIGGSGAREYIGNKEIERIISEAEDKNKVIGAICIAPMILLKSGILKGRKATVWNKDGLQSSQFEEKGVEYINNDVVIDDKLITADGPQSAKKFAETILKLVY